MAAKLSQYYNYKNVAKVIMANTNEIVKGIIM